MGFSCKIVLLAFLTWWVTGAPRTASFQPQQAVGGGAFTFWLKDEGIKRFKE
jgi:hypothetical protein